MSIENEAGRSGNDKYQRGVGGGASLVSATVAEPQNRKILGP